MLKQMGIVFCTTLAMTGCGPQVTRIDAGGSTFIDPIMQKWAALYRKQHGTEIDYIKKGSGYGIQQMTEKNFAFGCSDAPMSRAELEKATATGGPVLHIPLTMGAVAVVYNLPEIAAPLRLSGTVLADIFLRRTTKWNDPAIVVLNPGVTLPDAPISTVVRAESSGTTSVFTEYLNKVSSSYPAEMVSKKPRWPSGTIAQEGSYGVTSHVKANRYCIGFVEVLYARKNGLQTALIRNAAGNFIGPETANVTAAAAEAIQHKPTELPYTLHNLTYSITNAGGAQSYPIPAITYAVLYAKLNKTEGPEIVAFLKWTLTKGQTYSAELEYAPLPIELRARGLEQLNSVIFDK